MGRPVRARTSSATVATRSVSVPARSALGRRRATGEVARGRRLASRNGLPREEVGEIQRSRLLAGAAAAIEEHGYASTTVAHITRSAGVSRRTFYELFANCEACLATLIEDVVAFLEGELRDAGLDGLPWRERVRGGLLVILSFCDRESALARVCIVDGARGGPFVLAQRDALLARLALIVDGGRLEGPRASDCSPLTAEGLVGAALTIIQARLVRAARKSLTGLLGELMGMIVLPYQGSTVARREQARLAPKAPVGAQRRPLGLAGERDPLQEIPMRVTYRTARALMGIAEDPGASNRMVADHAGIHDQGQISKLLARLERLGLIANKGDSHEKGEPNSWSLTPLGDQVTQRLSMSSGKRPSNSHR
jgi:AcrR family transcriptional regulator